MIGTLLMIGFGVMLAKAAASVLFVIGMRRKWPAVMRPVVWFSRRFMNPTQMQTAGQPGAFAGIVRHVGRHSERAYETPVGIERDGDAFVIALPYGSSANWLRNVLAAGEATVVHAGEVVDVTEPALIPLAEVDEVFSPADQRFHRWFGVDQALRLERRGQPAGDSTRRDRRCLTRIVGRTRGAPRARTRHARSRS